MMNKISDFSDLKKYDAREEIGYTYSYQSIPWSNEVMKRMNKPSPPESPLKLAWLAEQERKKNANKF